MPRRAGLAMLMLSLLAAAMAPSPSSAADDAGIVLLVPQVSPIDRTSEIQMDSLWIDLPKRAAADAQVVISDIRTIPFARILREVPAGKNYCCPLIGRRAEREADYQWLAPMQRIIFSAYVLRERSNPPMTVNDLKEESVLTVRGVTPVQALAALGVSAIEVQDVHQALQMLQRGRVSAVVLGHVTAAWAEKTGIEIREAVPLLEILGYFVCSPDLDPAITRRLAAAIRGIFARGEDRAYAAADGLGAYYERMRPLTAEAPPPTADR